MDEETPALLHKICIKIYERGALYRGWKLSRKNQTEAGRNCLRKSDKEERGEKKVPNIFVTLKNSPPQFCLLPCSDIKLYHTYYEAHWDLPCFSSLLPPLWLVKTHSSPGGTEEPSPHWHSLPVVSTRAKQYNAQKNMNLFMGYATIQAFTWKRITLTV